MSQANLGKLSMTPSQDRKKKKNLKREKISEIAQQVKMLAARPDDPNSMPRSHMKEGTKSPKLSSYFHMHNVEHIHLNTYKT